MKKVSVLLSFLIATSQAASAEAPVRTQAKSALRILIDRHKDAGMRMPLDIEGGADISFICAASLFMQWGDRVYQSIENSPDAREPESMKEFANVRDSLNRSFRIVIATRKDLPSAVESVIKEYREASQMVTVPGDLNFASFASNEYQYFNSLNSCTEPQYIEKVSSRIAPLEDDISVNGVEAGATEVPSVLVRAGGGGVGDVPSVLVGAAAVSGGNLIIVDNANKFRKTKKYSDWIQTFVLGQ